MSNLDLYNRFSTVPKEAQKDIKAGRLKGMTDINPMWRIKMLTEEFGICGVGWKYVITDKRIVEGANGVVCAFVDIDLFVKVDGQWSDAIQGTGGSTFVAKENAGLYTSDECFKMALTDAISVACKALGMGANVYWQDGRTKYTEVPAETPPTPPTPPKPVELTPRQKLIAKLKEKGIDINAYSADKGLTKETTAERFNELLKELEEQLNV